MNEEMKQSFDVLDINTKRNKISNELIIIGELIKNFEINKGINSSLNVKNYNQNDFSDDYNMDENQMLTFLYEDIYNIEQELITVLSMRK